MSPLCVTLVSASLLLGAATAQTAGCCQTKVGDSWELRTQSELHRCYRNTAPELPCLSLLQVVGGSDSLAGTYNLYSGQATFLDICM